MQTVGEILKRQREKNNLTLTEAEAATKIRIKFLRALESDDYTAMPSVSYAKGFVKIYSDYLGLDSSRILAFFRRQTKEASKATLLPKNRDNPVSDSFFRLTPSKFIIMLVLILTFSFLGYFVIQYQRLGQPPKLKIEQPDKNLLTTSSKVEVFGSTDPDATVSINGINVFVRDDGNFFEQVNLEPGSNEIIIVATSRFGKNISKTITVGYQKK